jgi:hypothetical protein
MEGDVRDAPDATCSAGGKAPCCCAAAGGSTSDYTIEVENTSTKARKYRLNQLFRPDDVTRIDEAVRYVHSVMGNVTLLVKYVMVNAACVDRGGVESSFVLSEKSILDAIAAVRHWSPVATSSTEATDAKEERPDDGNTKNSEDKKRKQSTAGEKLETSSHKRRSCSSRINKKPKKKGKNDDDPDNNPDEPVDDVEVAARRDALRAARQDKRDSWSVHYVDMMRTCNYVDGFGSSSLLSNRGSGLSLSPMFSLAAKQYISAVVTNVRYHFRAYVCRSLGIVLRHRVCSHENVKTFDDLPSSVARRWKATFGKAYDDVMYHRFGDAMKCDEMLRPLVERHRWHLVPTLPARTTTIDRDLDSASRPFVYLAYMLRMTRFIERVGRSSKGCHRGLLSPIPLKTSFIPAHYNIDTTSVAHLLMNQGRIEEFKRYFVAHGGFELPGLKSKDTLCASLEKQSGRPVTGRDEELYMDALWTYLASFKNRKTRRLNPLFASGRKDRRTKAHLFDHSISTDGYSVALVVTTRETRCRKNVYKSGASVRMSKRVTTADASNTGATPEFPTLRPDTVDEVRRCMDDWGMTTDDCVGGDPGKGVLLQVVDRYGMKERYTAAQRRHEAGGKKKRRKQRRATSHRATSTHDTTTREPSVRQLNEEMRKKHISAKTCELDGLRKYMAFREMWRATFESAYWRPTFRSSRYQSWKNRDASVTAFAKRILEKYGNRRPHTRDVQVVILYGDWATQGAARPARLSERSSRKGRRPNLKHQAPTPGIGLRRLLHRTQGLKTITVPEAYTSSYCPKCEGTVSECRGQHGLLRCEDEAQCGTFWSRDVLGALNILTKGVHILSTGGSHPRFASR